VINQVSDPLRAGLTLFAEQKNILHGEEELQASSLVIGLACLVEKLNELGCDLRLLVHRVEDEVDTWLVEVQILFVEEEPVDEEGLADQGIDH